MRLWFMPTLPYKRDDVQVKQSSSDSRGARCDATDRQLPPPAERVATVALTGMERRLTTIVLRPLSKGDVPLLSGSNPREVIIFGFASKANGFAIWGRLHSSWTGFMAELVPQLTANNSRPRLQLPLQLPGRMLPDINVGAIQQGIRGRGFCQWLTLRVETVPSFEDDALRPVELRGHDHSLSGARAACRLLAFLKQKKSITSRLCKPESEIRRRDAGSAYACLVCRVVRFSPVVLAVWFNINYVLLNAEICRMFSNT
ncbi:hypothetical protein J6590_001080 [Homalodisca vitripennis]|nr:hypothetical protein J6590_001080 [Homalodisca vitripennis]